jgi:hypothetical protein
MATAAEPEAGTPEITSTQFVILAECVMLLSLQALTHDMYEHVAAFVDWFVGVLDIRVKDSLVHAPDSRTARDDALNRYASSRLTPQESTEEACAC